MKSESVEWKLPVLIGVLVIVALLINLFFFNKAAARREAKVQEARQAALAQEKKVAEEARQQAAKVTEAQRARNEAEAKAEVEEARKKAVEDAAAENSLLLVRYLNSGFTRKPGVATVGIAVESETGTMNPIIANALAQRLKTANVQLPNSFFKPEFVADKFVAKIFSGDTKVFNRLGLTNWLSGVLVGRQTITYITNTELQNTVSANLRLEVMVLPVDLASGSQSWNFSANGVAFGASDARQAAEERIVEQIANKTNLVLSPF